MSAPVESSPSSRLDALSADGAVLAERAAIAGLSAVLQRFPGSVETAFAQSATPLPDVPSVEGTTEPAVILVPARQ